MKIKKSFTHVETPGGIVKLEKPMTANEYYKWVWEYNQKIREKVEVKS